MTLARQELCAQILFFHDRTCCVCRRRGRPLHIHHIDSNHRNQEPENLAVLCMECHRETQVRGGFARKLDAHQVRLYRNDWLNIVGRSRTTERGVEVDSTLGISPEAHAEVAQILLAHRCYELLARHYHLIGDYEQRDRYIEIALAQAETSPRTEVRLRLLQGRVAEVAPERLAAWESQACSFKGAVERIAMLKQAGRPIEALLAYCELITQRLHAGDYFLAGFFLKRLQTETFSSFLFCKAYREFQHAEDLWMQVRCLKELGWEGDLKRLLHQNEDRIRRSGHRLLQFELARLNDERTHLNETYVALYRELAEKKAQKLLKAGL